MLSPQEFDYFSCASCGETIPTPECFTNACPVIPIEIYGPNDKFPTAPVPSLFSNSTCNGLSNAIANNSMVSFSLFLQYCVYASLLLFSTRLSTLELEEKNYCRFALHLKGVFITPTNKEVIRKGLPKNSWWLSSPCAFVYDRYCFVVIPYILTTLYLLTVFYVPPAKEEWYIFPSAQTGIDYATSYPIEFAGW